MYVRALRTDSHQQDIQQILDWVSAWRVSSNLRSPGKTLPQSEAICSSKKRLAA